MNEAKEMSTELYLDLGIKQLTFKKQEILELVEMCSTRGWITYCKVIESLRQAILDHTLETDGKTNYEAFVRFRALYNTLSAILSIAQGAKESLDSVKEKETETDGK